MIFTIFKGGVIDIVLPEGIRFSSLSPANDSLITLSSSLQLVFNGSTVDMPPTCMLFMIIN